MTKRLDSLDSWRAIAILSVMLFHYLVRYAPPLNPHDAYGFDYRYSLILELGRYGVQVFFVISGMVITMTLLRTRNALDFAVHRFARLYPGYIVCMTTTFVIITMFGPAFLKVAGRDYVGNLTMVANRVGVKFVDGAYWSLVVEIEFYFYIAVAWTLLKQRFWVAMIVLALLGAPAERLNAHAADAILLSKYMPYFLAGMAAWFILKENRRAAGATMGVTAAALYIFYAPTLTMSNQPSVLAFTVVGLTILAMIACVMLEIGNPVLAWIGRLSYSLYLIHECVGVSVITHAKSWAPDWLAICLAMGISVLLAWLCFTYVEQPGARFVRLLWNRVRSWQTSRAARP